MLIAVLLIVDLLSGRLALADVHSKADLPSAPALHGSARQPLLQPIWQVKED